MCDANDNAVHVVFGQTEEGRPYAVYHASKMLNDAIKNTQLLRSYAIVFAFDKFKAYLLGISRVVSAYHSTLKYLPSKEDARARLIRWILLLQEFINGKFVNHRQIYS